MDFDEQVRSAETMTWVRLDDRYPEHPKVDKVGPHAAWLNVCAWAYCARNMTDGFVPAERVDRLATVPNPRKLVAALVAVNLWEKVEGGYRVHDFLDYNPSREQVLAERARNADRVSRHRNGVSNDVGNAITPPITAPISNGVSTGAPYPARPGPLRRETNTPSVAIATSPPAGKAARRTIVDDEFRESLVSEYASAFGSRASVQSVIDEALSHKAMAKRTDHRAYLRNWVRRDAEAAVRRREGFKATLSVVEAIEPECSCEEIRQSDARGDRNMPRMCELHGFRPPPARRGPTVVGISPEVIQKCSECGSDGAYGQIRGRRLCTSCATRSEVREEAHA